MNMTAKFQVRAYFDFGNGEKFSRIIGDYNHYPTDDELLKDILFAKSFYDVCKFKYAKVEKIYVLN